MYSDMDDQALQPDRVPPFGYPRIVVCLRLPEAFRRSLRPSSALYAKTSAVRPFSFNLLRELFLDFRFKIFFLSFATFQKDLSVFLLLFSFQRTSCFEASLQRSFKTEQVNQTYRE